LRAGESGARIAPEPIDTRKKKESRATIDRTLSVMQCPTLFAFFQSLMRRHGDVMAAGLVQEALEADGLILHAQSIVSLAVPSMVCGYELLIRMRGKDGFGHRRARWDLQPPL
jgi:sensor c-di-GMP phosphodiesterase-like protein